MLASHIPAWKRIGLQLKNQAEDAGPTPKKRRLDIEETGQARNKRSATKQKFALKTGDLNAIAAGADSSSQAELAASTNGEDSGVQSTRSKSKQHEEPNSDNRARADAKGTVTSANDSQSSPSNQQAENAGSLATIATPQPRSKVEKRQASLEYLKQHYEDHDNWKFNTQQQARVFKDCFNLYRIPYSYEESLLAYIRGVQSEAARERLKRSAEAIVQDESTMANATDDMKTQRRGRAQRVLEVLRETEQVGSNDEAMDETPKIIQEPKDSAPAQDDVLIANLASEQKLEEEPTQKSEQPGQAKAKSKRGRRGRGRKNKLRTSNAKDHDSGSGSEG